ncbi:serine/threonine protein phosphatase (Nem1-Spo7 complex) regulatory subunit [Schizosaccharomyces osmophilus]|uniref:Serine/threonine protein phosphatase (Nem1-Spo7 complex) regulatory subunit n=1 Tax=Schizosaccharomyces osmophilus TaxID=2545709 RepID=A0AAE9WAB5_9SCHI|nr:serine/threonine protein phosphatase (Nem1-Spo7 complex) regulatory subunit [Schizosaccharomyces osmophilus]WBW72190.1 serine/threonine protein phosphatase (Nem1-Spo7 complex) regulatory subunit [Schizosaccharomyces osmophilus]
MSSPFVPNTLAVYHNLLILEASFRKTYLQLCSRRRKYLAFYISMLTWNIYFSYRVFFRVSLYSLIDLIYKLCLLSGIVTMLLFYVLGLYRSSIAYPSRYVQQTNKALRLFNIRLVITSVPFFQFRNPLDHGVHLVLSSKRFDILVIEGWEAFRTAYLTSEQRRQKRKKQFRKSSATIAPSSALTQKSRMFSSRPKSRREDLAKPPQLDSL